VKYVLSCGAGVQSSTLAMMFAHGEFDVRLDAAVFSDVGAESAKLYQWLDTLQKMIKKAPHPFPFHIVSKGNLHTDALLLRKYKEKDALYARSLIPVYLINPDGSKGHLMRVCTYDYKVIPLTRFARKFGGIKSGQKTVGVIQYIGISKDEASRMKPSREPWVEHQWPLIDRGMTRQDCFKWMADHNYPTPPRSACYFCPFHSDKEWLRLKNEEPEEFQKAVEFERELQANQKKVANLNGIPFLHNSRVPLDQVAFKEDQQLHLFDQECEGMCGV